MVLPSRYRRGRADSGIRSTVSPGTCRSRRGRGNQDVGSIEHERSPPGCPVTAVLWVDTGEAAPADAYPHLPRIPINGRALAHPSSAPPDLVAEADD